MKTLESRKLSGQLLIKEKLTENYLRVFYVFLLCLSLTINLIVGSVHAADEITYYHNDVSGTPLVSTNSAGEVLWKENYQPYGDKLNNQPSSKDNQIGYHGKPYDNASGLSYMQARYYDPTLGRFMGVDPVLYQEDSLHSFNRYAYANNNPYKYVDPDGNIPVLLIAAAEMGGFLLTYKAMMSGEPPQAKAAKAVDFAAKGFTKTALSVSVSKGMAEQASRKSAGQLGREGEALASKITGVGKNTQSYKVDGRTRIPDQVISVDRKTKTPFHVVEAKYVASQGLTKQLKDNATLVGVEGRVDVFVKPSTYITGPLRKASANPASPIKVHPVLKTK